MSIQFLKNDIAERSFRKIYLITGNEPYLKNYYFSALKNSMLTAEEEAFDFIKTDGDKLSAEEFSEYIMSLPMSAAKKLFLIVDLPLSSPVIQLLTQNPDLLSESCCLVILCNTEKYDKRTAEYKNLEMFVKNNGLSVTLDTPPEKDLVKWVISRFQKQKTEIDYGTAEYFTSCVGPDMYLLKNEADKLISYKSGKGKITAEDVDLLTTKSFDAKSYELTNAIFAKDYDGAYEICRKLFAMNTYPLIVLYTIENAVASLVKTKILLGENRSEREIAQIMKIKEYPAKKNCETARRISEKNLSEMLSACVEADIASKSSAISTEDLIYKLIAECITRL